MINQDDILRTGCPKHCAKQDAVSAIIKDYEKYLKENKDNVPRWIKQKVSFAKAFLNFLGEKKIFFEQVTKETVKEYFTVHPARKTGTGTFLEFLESKNIISLEKNFNIAENSSPGFEELLEKYIRYLAVRNLREKTLEITRRSTRRFFQYLKQNNINDINRVTKKVMSDYALHLLLHKTKEGRNYQVNTRRTEIVNIRRFFRFLCREDLLLSNPAQDVDVPKAPFKISRDVPSVEDIDKIIASIDKTTMMGVRNTAIIETLYGTGVRANELNQLEMKDLDFEQKLLTVRQGKGRKDRVVPINDTALSWIREYFDKREVHLKNRPQDNYLFVNFNGSKIAVEDITKMIKRITAKSGIPKHIIAHSFRYACATHMLKNGADIRYVQEMLGHECLISTQGYTKVVKGDLRKMIRKFHPREADNE